MALELINTDSMDTQQTFGIDQPKSVSFRTIDGTTYLFVAGKGDEIGSASVFSMGSDGVLTSIQHVFDGGPLELEGAASAVTAEIEGTVYLFVAGTTDDGLSVFAVGEDGRLTNVDNVADDGTLRLNGVNSVATATFGDTTFLIVASRIDGGISSYSIAANGTLAEVQSIADDGTLFTDGSSAVHVAVIDSLTYAFVAGSTDSGVSVFRVASDGTMTNVDNVGDGGDLELSSAGAVTTALVGDTTYLFVAGYSDSGISVFAVASDGTLSNVDNVSDDGTVNLALASGLTTAVIDGVTYLFATGQNDDGFSVFEVAGNGTLINVANIADAGALELRGPSGLATVEIDGVLYLAVAGRLDNGVSVFRTEHNIIDEAAEVVEVAENGTAVVTVDKLYDDDTLAYTITGGDDAALFSVDAATGAVTFIDAPDFEAPQDADGDNIYDIEVTADDGIITEAKALAIEITDVGGLDISGTKTGETLTGGGEEDTIAGRGGKDIL
ncbi:beta-propeller fold lactonase family protein, partial [Bauldia litoralis]